MATIVNGADLTGLRIIPLDPGGFFISAHCSLCREIVSLRLTAGDVGSRTLRETDCRSGSDGLASFQLCARYSPEETDDPSGMDVWGEVFESSED